MEVFCWSKNSQSEGEFCAIKLHTNHYKHNVMCRFPEYPYASNIDIYKNYDKNKIQ